MERTFSPEDVSHVKDLLRSELVSFLGISENDENKQLDELKQIRSKLRWIHITCAIYGFVPQTHEIVEAYTIEPFDQTLIGLIMHILPDIPKNLPPDPTIREGAIIETEASIDRFLGIVITEAIADLNDRREQKLTAYRRAIKTNLSTLL